MVNKIIRLSKKQIRLLLSVLDSCKYDSYYEEWDWVDNKESKRLENKLLEGLDDFKKRKRM